MGIRLFAGGSHANPRTLTLAGGVTRPSAYSTESIHFHTALRAWVSALSSQSKPLSRANDPQRTNAYAHHLRKAKANWERGGPLP